MADDKRHINRESEGAKKMSNGYRFEGDVLHTNDDSVLFQEVSSYMRAKFDIEEVKSDPLLNDTRYSVRSMIADYRNSVSAKKNSRENIKFIKDSISIRNNEEEITKEIHEIKQESGKSGLELVTADWVKEWHKQKQMAGAGNTKSKEINEFIKSSLANQPVVNFDKPIIDSKKPIIRSVFIKYLSLSAAALIGAFVILNSLLPPPSTEKLFSSFYTPFEAISPVTRSEAGNSENLYFSAVNDYILHNYTKASEKFSEAIHNDPTSGSALFFMGLTSIELGNYEKAISDLSSVISGSGEYMREAQWYLGMAYLKTGNREKAAECFNELANSSQYYRERSEKLLRRLK